MDRQQEAQALFDTVLTKLREQKVAAGTVTARGNFVCRYRGDNGAKCAVGHLIPDENYDPEFEGSGVYTLASRLACPSEIKRHENLLGSLQSIHDQFLPREGFPSEYRGLDKWEEKMEKAAAIHGVKYTHPE